MRSDRPEGSRAEQGGEEVSGREESAAEAGEEAGRGATASHPQPPCAGGWGARLRHSSCTAISESPPSLEPTPTLPEIGVLRLLSESA